MKSPTDLVDNKDRQRFEAHIDGKLVGFAEYISIMGLMIFSQTEVLPAYEGKGVGSAHAKFALDDVRADGTQQVQLLCPFISDWIERHDDYQDLVG